MTIRTGRYFFLAALLLGSCVLAMSHWGALQRSPKHDRAHRPVRSAHTAAAPPLVYSLETVEELPFPVSYAIIADMTGDGKNDLWVYSGTLEPAPFVLLFTQLPGGVLGPGVKLFFPQYLNTNTFLSVKSADLNEDGREDVIATLRYGGVATYVSQPGGGYAWSIDEFDTRMAFETAVEDFNDDGHKDLVVFGVKHGGSPYSSSFSIYYGDGTGAFAAHALMPTGEDEGYFITAGDYTGDGRPDLASFTRNGVGHGLVLRRNGGSQGLLDPIVHYAKMTEGLEGIAIGDVNGDGRNDIVAHNNLASPMNQIQTFLQNADGTLAALPTVTAAPRDEPVGVKNFTVRDLNNDGLADVVFSYQYDEFYYLLSRGDRYADAVTVAPGNSMNYLAFGDLNSDGILDVVNAGDGDTIAILHGKLTPYTGTATPPAAPTMGTASVNLATYEHLGGKDTIVNVPFTPPFNNGGAPILGYSVYSIPDGARDLNAGSTQLEHHITHLENGVDYRFFVAATNSAGQGPASAMSNLVQIRDIPMVRFWESYAREGTSESTLAKVKLILDYPALPGGASIQVTTSPGTAAAGSDYVHKSTWVSIPQGQTEGYFEIPIVADQLVEPVETFFATITGVNGAALPRDVRRPVTVVDDDEDLPAGRINNPWSSIVEGDSGSSPVTVSFGIEYPVKSDVQFDVAIGGGTATPGVDYLPVAPVRLTIPAGAVSVALDVTVLGDTEDEDMEVINVTVSNVTGASDPWESTVIYIMDNELPVLTVQPMQVTEGDSGILEVTMVASLSRPHQPQVEFDVVTLDGQGTATANEDYLSRVIPAIVLPPWERSQTFKVYVKGDSKLEASEQLKIGLANIKYATAGTPGTVTVLNDDIPGGLSIDDAAIDEGNVGTTPAGFMVRLSAPQTQPVTFDFYTAPGTAIPGTDYAEVAATGLVIQPGSTSLFVPVSVIGDVEIEKHETLTGNLNNVAGAVVTDYQARGRIVDDDMPDVWIEDLTVVEGSEGMMTAYFNVRLSRPVDYPVRFYAFSDRRAPTFYFDYRADPKDMQFDPGRTLMRYAVLIVGDDIAEGNETFNIFIENVQNANVVDNWGLGTIIDDDAPTTTVAGAGIASSKLACETEGCQTRP